MSKRNTFISLLFLSIILILPTQVLANERVVTLKGQVCMENREMPISDAKVEIFSGQKLITVEVTDSRGEFAAHVVQGLEISSLRISHLSYRTKVVRMRQKIINDLTLPTVYLHEDHRLFDDVLITSTRTMHQLKDIPVPTMVVGRGEIERIAPNSVKDLLLYAIPGIEFRSHGHVTHVTIQGYDAKYFTFLVDGEEMAGLKDGSPDFLRLSPENIERIEVVKGAGVALYGSNAIGGVINIITRKSTQPVALSVSAGYTHKSQYNGDVLLGLNKGSWNSTTSLSTQKVGGYSIKSKSDDDPFRIVPNFIYRGAEKLRWSPTDQFYTTINLSGSKRIQKIYPEQHDHYDDFSAIWSGAYQFSVKSSVKVDYHADYSLRRRFYPLASKDTKDLLHRNLKQLLRGQYNHTFIKGRSDLNVGVELHRETLKSFQIKDGKDKKSVDYLVAFGQHLWKPVNAVTLLYGARVDVHSTYGTQFSPKFSLSYNHGNWIVRGGYAAGFKAPDMMELYYEWSHMGMFMINGNAELKPEIAHQLMGGVQYEDKSWTLSADLNHSIFHNEIFLYQKDKLHMTYDNVDGTSNMTVANAKATWRVCNGFTLNGSYVYTYHPVYKEVKGEQVNVSTTRPHNLLMSCQAYKGIGDWSLSATLMGQYLSEITTHEISKDQVKDLKYDGYFMMRGTASALYKKYRLTVGVDNILDFLPSNNRQYGYLSPGRTFFAKLGYTF